MWVSRYIQFINIFGSEYSIRFLFSLLFICKTKEQKNLLMPAADKFQFNPTDILKKVGEHTFTFYQNADKPKRVDFFLSFCFVQTLFCFFFSVHSFSSHWIRIAFFYASLFWMHVFLDCVVWAIERRNEATWWRQVVHSFSCRCTTSIKYLFLFHFLSSTVYKRKMGN